MCHIVIHQDKKMLSYLMKKYNSENQIRNVKKIPNEKLSIKCITKLNCVKKNILKLSTVKSD